MTDWYNLPNKTNKGINKEITQKQLNPLSVELETNARAISSDRQTKLRILLLLCHPWYSLDLGMQFSAYRSDRALVLT